LKAIKDVIVEYPEVDIDIFSSSIHLFEKPRCLFHYRNELQQYAEGSDKSLMKEHVAFCLKYMSRSLAKEISSFNAMMQGQVTDPGITYHELWMAYRPGTLVYRKGQDSERIYKFISMDENQDDKDRYFWHVNLEQLESNGTAFGRTKDCIHIYRYDGFRALKDQEICPLEFVEGLADLKKRIRSRGQKYASLHGVHYRMYEGRWRGIPSHRGTHMSHVNTNLPHA
jgi:hypothetical protein